MLKSPVQVFFLLCAIGAILGITPFTYYCYIYVANAIKHKPSTYIFPNWMDFKWTIFAALIYACIDIVLGRILIKLLKPLCKVQDDVVERDRRTEKSAKNFV